MKENEISFYVRKCIFSVYNELGPGLLEKVYEKVLAHELENNGLMVKTQVPMNLKFKDTVIESGFIADIIVENKVIIEIKAITDTDYINKSIFRKVNGELD
ncbi:GxxExxY protein [Chryseobacterium sp. W4I1]|uniref:GxxExxY protein n=1 Tax=Chryseobacterium sp. W4I1 TaxID=3042293 RepID=UPI002783B72A|nr:GxxExxY protein [Chryseobacterium sp. W4I1]MDQ0781953.1 GxxExxY protein [Chryseobacterium sp. W4I1]